MALDPSQVAELRATLRSFGAACGVATVPTGAGKALELWVYMKLARAALYSTGWRVVLCDSDGSVLAPGRDFKVRKRPAGLGLHRQGGASWIQLSLADGMRTAKGHLPTLEMHCGLQWLGKSGALHECDISLLPMTLAWRIRNRGGGSPAGMPILALECKDRGSRGNLDEMREMLGRTFDLTRLTQSSHPRRGRMFDSNLPGAIGWGSGSSKYRQPLVDGLFGIVRTEDFQSGARTLGLHYNIKMYEYISRAIYPEIRLMNDFRYVLNRSLTL